MLLQLSLPPLSWAGSSVVLVVFSCCCIDGPRFLKAVLASILLSKQPTSSAIKEGDTVLYKPTAEGEKEGRARVIKVHPDAEGPHYTILPHGKDAKEKNTTADRISKVNFLFFHLVSCVLLVNIWLLLCAVATRGELGCMSTRSGVILDSRRNRGDEGGGGVRGQGAGKEGGEKGSGTRRMSMETRKRERRPVSCFAQSRLKGAKLSISSARVSGPEDQSHTTLPHPIPTRTVLFRTSFTAVVTRPWKLMYGTVLSPLPKTVCVGARAARSPACARLLSDG